MDILKLRIVNFLTIGDSGDLALSNKGLVLIQGRNEDDSSQVSNGAGKSSVPDALCWALYGTTARGESGDAIINNKAKKNCKVAVTVQDGDTIYQITRHRKDAIYKNQTTVTMWNPAAEFEVTAGQSLAKGTEAETQVEIEKIMGCSQMVFLSAVYAGQELMPDLPRMTDKELKLVVEQGSGIERIESAYATARLKENEVKATRDSQMLAVSTLENQALVRAKSNVMVATENHRKFEEGREPVRIANADKAREIGEAIKAAATQLAKIDEPSLKAELAEIQEKFSEHNAVTVQKERLWAAVVKQETEVSHMEKTVLRMKAAIDKLNQQIADAPAAMKEPCSECGKPHTPDELEAFVGHIKVRKAADEVQIPPVEQEVAKAKAAVALSRDAWSSFVVPDVTAIAARMATVQKLLQTAEAIRNLMRLKAKDFEAATEAAKNAKTAVNPHESALTLANSQVAEIESQVAAGKLKVQATEEALQVAEAVTKVFSPAGVRARILDSVTPFLNDRTSEYLNALSDGNMKAVWSTLGTTAKGDLRERFNIDVESATGGSSFGLISGGEKRKVRLATCLALQDLVASRATKPINLWIGDEIDDALDASGLERLMVILEKKARERGTLLAISHNELSDWIDQTATVVKSGGVSKVEGVLSV